MKTCRAVLISLFLLAGALSAQQAAAPEAESPLKSTMTSFIVQTTAEGESFAPADKIEPGNVIEYRIVYRNEADRPLRQIKAGALIPESTFYVPESATASGSQDLLFSIDGGETYAVPPIHYTRSKEDGTTEQAVASPDMYNRIRWVIPVLEPGAERTLVYRVQVQ